MASVVVPAHNEEAVLAQGLERLLAGMSPGELDVVVVANACTDGTAEVARGLGVRVIETPVPGKRHALQLGDGVCRVFPRLYLDADVQLAGDSFRAMLTELARPGVLACAPEPEWDLTGASRLARRVHRVHDTLLSGRRGLAGVGAYALTEEGHARAFPLPDVVADDEWVHRGFLLGERVVARGARSVVRPAASLRTHLMRRVRVRLGNRQLVELGRPAPDGPIRLSRIVGLLARREVSLLDAGCYLAVKVLERALAARRARQGGPVLWARDDGSRAEALSSRSPMDGSPR